MQIQGGQWIFNCLQKGKREAQRIFRLNIKQQLVLIKSRLQECEQRSQLGVGDGAEWIFSTSYSWDSNLTELWNTLALCWPGWPELGIYYELHRMSLLLKHILTDKVLFCNKIGSRIPWLLVCRMFCILFSSWPTFLFFCWGALATNFANDWAFHQINWLWSREVVWQNKGSLLTVGFTSENTGLCWSICFSARLQKVPQTAEIIKSSRPWS